MAFFDVVYLILKFVDDYLTTNYLNLYLINKFFRFDDDDLNKNRRRATIIEILPKESSRVLNKGESINEEILEKSKLLIKVQNSNDLCLREKEDYFKRFEEFYQNISGKIFEKNIYRLTCPDKKDVFYSLYEKYSKITDNYLDFEYLIKVMNDVNKIKMLLMTPHQRKIFDFYYINYYFVEKQEIFPDKSKISLSNFLSLFEKSDSHLTNFLNEKLLNTINYEIASYSL